jgi:secretion/DNA translocation related TadE-like protein
VISLASDSGSGTVLAVGLTAAVAVVAAAVLPLSQVLVARTQAAGAADAAALAAADVASGRHAGYPCELAAEVASTNGTALQSCEVDGLVVTVGVSRGILGFTVGARATAGPPPMG